ncbi:hypothetical protein Zm00014a_024870 [Zea mays]|uniref:DUF4283 domain-containing protein n=1 Tax=Zea mays TaxID=4577 RepID=A0A3L6D889_MAIZE|nr:hypothetical protein Zm00014a_024870 [Zea mays]
MQFPSQERLDEMMSFPELKMKMSGAKIAVVPWSSRAKPKSRLHTAWIVAENVPEELQNYQSICEIGSMIGAVEEVDLMSLDSEDIVRFKVHIKSVATIPPVVEVAVKPFYMTSISELNPLVMKDGMMKQLIWVRELRSISMG